MATVSEVEEILSGQPNVSFSAKELASMLRTKPRSINVAIKGAITKGATSIMMDSSEKFFWPIEVASNLGQNVPDDDSDIIEPRLKEEDVGEYDEWSAGDTLKVISVARSGLVCDCDGEAYFVTALPIEEFIDQATTIFREKIEREKVF